jgi:DNA-binding CsgD family transcriptional regulator
MPGVDVQTRMGEYSMEITPRTAKVLLALREHKSTHKVATLMDISIENVATTVRIAERKLNVRLFERSTGVPEPIWRLWDTTQTRTAWKKLQAVYDYHESEQARVSTPASSVGLGS